MTDRSKILNAVILSFLLTSCTTTTSTKKQPDPVKVATSKSNVLINLGMAYAERGQYQVAMDQYKKALKIYPKSFDAHTAIANLYETIEQPELAQQHYQKAIDLAPDNPSTLNNYGKYLCNNSRYSEAEEYFSKAAKTPLYSRPWLPLTNAGQCMQRAGHLERAEQDYRQALKKNPEYAPALMAMAKLSYQQNKYRTARAFLQRYEAVQPLSVEQLKMAIDIEQSLGDDEAAKHYAELLDRRLSGVPRKKTTTRTTPESKIDNSQLPSDRVIPEPETDTVVVPTVIEPTQPQAEKTDLPASRDQPEPLSETLDEPAVVVLPEVQQIDAVVPSANKTLKQETSTIDATSTIEHQKTQRQNINLPATDEVTQPQTQSIDFPPTIKQPEPEVDGNIQTLPERVVPVLDDSITPSLDKDNQ